MYVWICLIGIIQDFGIIQHLLFLLKLTSTALWQESACNIKMSCVCIYTHKMLEENLSVPLSLNEKNYPSAVCQQTAALSGL